MRHLIDSDEAYEREEHKYDEARSNEDELACPEVWLGSGDKVVADIYANDGSWAGVGIFNPPNGKTGGIGEKDGQIDRLPLDKNKALVLIKSTRPESLQVVIEELQEAIAKMGVICDR